MCREMHKSKDNRDKYNFGTWLPVERRLICYSESKWNAKRWKKKFEYKLMTYSKRSVFLRTEKREKNGILSGKPVHILEIYLKFGYRETEKLSNKFRLVSLPVRIRSSQIIRCLNRYASQIFVCIFFVTFFFSWHSKNCIRNGETTPAVGISLLSTRVRSLPHQISLLCQSLEIWKYICQLKMENMSKQTE